MAKTKEAYKLEINGHKMYFSFTYGGWQTACAIVHAIFGEEDKRFPLPVVRVPADKQLLDD